MSSESVSSTPPTPPGDSGSRSTDRIVVYRHSHLFYWWPIWVLGFLFAGITRFDDKHLAIVPANTPHSVVAITDGRAIVIDYPLRPGFAD